MVEEVSMIPCGLFLVCFYFFSVIASTLYDELIKNYLKATRKSKPKSKYSDDDEGGDGFFYTSMWLSMYDE
jgi:hypothetical protein